DLPVADYVERLNRRMQPDLANLQKTQTSRLSGKVVDNGVAYDAKEPLATPLAIRPPPLEGGVVPVETVRNILSEIGVQPIKKSTVGSNGFKAEAMPKFAAKTMDEYKAEPGQTPIREAVAKARKILHDIAANKDNLQQEFRVPANEMQFKKEIETRQRTVAKILGELFTAQEELDEAGKVRDQEASKRWLAHYDYMRARVRYQIAHIFEYTSLLGQMRKELPPRDANLHNGWR